MTTMRAVDYGDVQGLVRFGYGHLPAASFFLLRIRDRALAAHCLMQLPFTTAEILSPPPATALQVAFSASGLRALGIDDSLIEAFSIEFVSGMTGQNRSRRLGDEGPNSPEQWTWGGEEQSVPHALLMCYARTGELQTLVEQVINDEFRAAFHIDSELSGKERITEEPFGFADGISQPDVDWERQQTADIHRRDKYSNLLSLGEVLLGYPNEYGAYTDRPLLNPAVDAEGLLADAEDDPGSRDLGLNGSYLVLRQLEQDVTGFWQAVDAAAGGDIDQRESLAAAMVGRQRDGTPLVPLSEQLIEGTAEKVRKRNNFNYDNDLAGRQCPIASHVRRSNPRTGDFPPGPMGLFNRLRRILGFDKDYRDYDLVASTRFHRILRRGRPYGPDLTPRDALNRTTPGEPAGLHFMCLNTNLARQFEFVQGAWIVNPKFAGLQNEEDPVMGGRSRLHGGGRTDNFSRLTDSGSRERITSMQHFVKVRGGAYFFLPGIRALKFLCRQSFGREES